MSAEKLFTIKQAADLLGVHRVTLYEWMRSGQLEYVYVGQRRRIPQSALDAFIRKGKRESPQGSDSSSKPESEAA